jgi:Ca2+-binding RTX toxin-like protein
MALALVAVGAIVISAQAKTVDCSNADPSQAQNYQPNGCKKKGAGFTIKGTNKADKLVGSDGDDSISALAGNDRVNARDGDDKVLAGPGKDTVSGGPGDDTINVKGGGADRVSCGTGDDTVKADKKDSVSRNCETVK